MANTVSARTGTHVRVSRRKTRPIGIGREDADRGDEIDARDLSGGLADPHVTTRSSRRGSRRSAGRLLDLSEAELYSGISVWTLRDLIASGELPSVRPPHLRRVWIDRNDLDEAIARWKERAR